MTFLSTGVVTLSDVGLSQILGGFGMFILGIQFLGDGLKDAAGPKIRDYIEKYTGNLFSAILVGLVITAIMQSSSAATVISISLVSAGLMTLEQAIGISVGANIGTTVTALIIGFNIDDFGFYFLFLGAIFLAFSKKKKQKQMGQILFAFGITFVGLKLMSDKLILLKDLPQFEMFMLKMSGNSWLALATGTVLTGIINSSSAFIGLIQKIYEAGGMDMVAATAFVFGSNIGTTVTALLASIGGNISMRRAAWFHVIFNVIGAFLMMLILKPYVAFVLTISELIGVSGAFSVAIAHFLFNIVATIIVIPLVPAFIRMLKILIPGEDKVRSRTKTETLDYNLIATFPEGALELASNTTVKMADLALEAVQTSQMFLNSKSKEDYDAVFEIEELVNSMDTNLTAYLLEIAKQSQGGYITETYTKYLEIIKNYERISDLSTNIVEFFHLAFENKDEFSEDALFDLDTMYTLVMDILNRSLKIFKHNDLRGYQALLKDEEYLDLIEEKYREKHFQRMAEGICYSKVASSIFIDALGILERIGDHGVNVARYVSSVVKLHDGHDN